MGPKNPLSLQSILKIEKLSQKENFWNYRITLSGGKAIKKTLKNKLIGGQQSNEKESSDLADQRSRSDQKIAIGGGRRRISEHVI